MLAEPHSERRSAVTRGHAWTAGVHCADAAFFAPPGGVYTAVCPAGYEALGSVWLAQHTHFRRMARAAWLAAGGACGAVPGVGGEGQGAGRGGVWVWLGCG